MLNYNPVLPSPGTPLAAPRFSGWAPRGKGFLHTRRNPTSTLGGDWYTPVKPPWQRRERFKTAAIIGQAIALAAALGFGISASQKDGEADTYVVGPGGVALEKDGHDYTAQMLINGALLVQDKKPVIFPADMINTSAPASVMIQAHFEKYIQQGSGVFIRDRQGNVYILTNRHVVNREGNLPKSMEIRPFGQDTILKAQVLDTDEKLDLALLKLDDTENYQPEVFIPSSRIRDYEAEPIREGEPILLVGNPHGMWDRLLPGFAHFLYGSNVLEFLAACDGGVSGGPVFDAEGKLIGIAKAQYGTVDVNQGHCIAVPANDMVAWLQAQGVDVEAGAGDPDLRAEARGIREALQ